MASNKTVAAAAAVLLFGAVLGVLAAQSAEAPKPLVRKDLLVLGTGDPPPLVRDIFRPKTTAAPPAVRRAAGPVTAGPAVAPAEIAPAR